MGQIGEEIACPEWFMVGVVQATCPGCRKVLRIPADWLYQAVRCKHCGMSASVQPVVSPSPPLPAIAAFSSQPAPAAPVNSSGVATAAADPIVASPAMQPASAAFSALTLDDGSPAPVRRRHRRGRLKRRIYWGVFFLCVIVLTIVFWPLIQDAVSQAKSQIAAMTDSDYTDRAPAPIEEKPTPNAALPKDTIKSDPPKKETPKSDVPRKEGPPKDKSGADPPKKDAPKRDLAKNDPPKKGRPVDPSPTGTGLFPRRALAVSVNNYLFLNPINYGSPDRRANSVRTLLERFTSGLRVPAEQVFELSDAAAMRKAHPPVKPAVERAITDFLGTSRPQDRIVVLLVAHTAEIDGEPYVIPLEGDQGAKDRLIPLAWIYEKLAAAPARQKILILDTCRFNPTRGQERPGGEPMNEKLDAKLKEPPPGVQVWTACVSGQRSYEFDNSHGDGKIDNGLFLDCLQRALVNGIDGPAQRPEEPIRMEALVDKVNALMKAELASLKLEQTSRLSGKEAEGGAAYDPKQQPAAKFAVIVPPPAGEDTASLEEVRSIMKQIAVPPLKRTSDDMLLQPEAMPPFSAKLLAEYKDDGMKSPLRDAVEKAHRTLNEQLKRLDEEWSLKGRNEANYKTYVQDYQKQEVARTMRELEEALDDLRAAGKEGRKNEKSKRGQANYDYIFARLEAQLAYLYEYDSALGEMRKELPPGDPNNGWRLASQKKLSGDPQGRKYMADSGKIFDKLAKDHAGTPWEILAKRDRLTNLGLQWQPNK
jgi:hypothetical protein